mmetsp:Transcript_55620/g.169195  ORF Transcript_55620/g.169195 Transcript_55620/m.169195 type:complete len:253 (+) Transcript_55620:75-833(+)
MVHGVESALKRQETSPVHAPPVRHTDTPSSALRNLSRQAADPHTSPQCWSGVNNATTTKLWELKIDRTSASGRAPARNLGQIALQRRGLRAWQIQIPGRAGSVTITVGLPLSVYAPPANHVAHQARGLLLHCARGETLLHELLCRRQDGGLARQRLAARHGKVREGAQDHLQGAPRRSHLREGARPAQGVAEPPQDAHLREKLAVRRAVLRDVPDEADRSQPQARVRGVEQRRQEARPQLLHGQGLVRLVAE